MDACGNTVPNSATSEESSPTMSDELRAAIKRVLPGVRADLDNLIRIPSISADPGAAAEVRRSAEVTAGYFRQTGRDSAWTPEVEILDGVAGGQPAVLARYPAPPGKPTVLLYAHHDVQPTGDPAAWTSGPFEPTERDGRLYGRGAADDKAGVAVHLAALRAFDGQPPVGVTVFVEGEEEIGSPTLGAFLERYRDKLAADVIVLADSANLEAGTPAFTTSLRGLTDCVVEVRALGHGVHSGGYGGAAPDALTALCRLLATLHDDKGNVAIAGLASGEAPKVDYPEERFRSEAGMLDGVRLLGTGSIAERIWAKPSASVLAIDATRVADASNTLIPSARAKVSVRLAPGEDAARAQEALIRHLREHAPWGVQVHVTDSNAGKPFSVDTTPAAFGAARTAYQEAYDREPVDVGVGGSIPFVAEFASAFPQAAILVTSAGADPDCRAHGADESLHLGDFEHACLAEALLLAKLAGSNGQPEA
jgi:cysteinylglycine-S-conjugate dipeptidase